MRQISPNSNLIQKEALKLDYIIAGQGLAGSILGHMLIRKGYRLRIFDKGENLASSVAAGLFNPITGKRWVKTWKAEDVFPFLHRYYPKLQEEIGEEFFFPRKVYRIFSTQREQNEWSSKSRHELESLYADRVVTTPLMEPVLENPFGGLLIKNSGFVNTEILLQGFMKYFMEKEVLIRENFDEDDLVINASGLTYKNFSFEKIIYCTGLASSQSRYFSWLPFNPVKGEILQVELPVNLEYIISHGLFIIQESPSCFKVGATYERGNTNPEISDPAREEMLTKLGKILHVRPVFLSQVAGIRPATRDRRPFIGIHPAFDRIAIFNGFGTKGISLIPYFSGIFIDHLEGRSNLDPAINIMRYFN